MRLRPGRDTELTVDAKKSDSRLPAVAIGGGRVAIGALFAADPVLSMRMLGVDSATANRLSWLARMAAARDIALGVGTVVSSVCGRGSGGWLLAGAACDVADAAALGHALSRRQVAPVPTGAVIGGALAAAGVALVVAARRPASYLEK